MTTRLNGIVFALLTTTFTFGILTLWIPQYWPWAAAQSLLLLAAGLCLLWWAARPGSLLISWWVLLPGGVVVLGAAQLLFLKTVDAWLTRRTLLDWITYAAAAFLAFQVCGDSHLRSCALELLAVSAAVLTFISTLQNYSAPGRVLWLFDSGYPDTVFGPFVYHVKLANFAELAIPAAVWNACRHPPRRTLYLVCAAVLAGGVVASASRGGILILVVEMIGLTLVAAPRRRVFAAALLAVMVCGSALFGGELALHRFASVPAGDDARWTIDASSLQMARRYWLTGSGLGTWSLVYPEFARFDLHQFINQAHCDWLQWLDEGGVSMLAIMLFMFAATLKAARREWWTLGLVFVWLHGLIDYPMQQTPAFACLQIAFWGGAMAVNSDFGRAVAVRRK